jgi:GNAT superfamily N-acetyltransferase
MTRDERVMLAAYRCLYPQAREIGGATVLRSDEAPGSPMLNRIVGLGRNGPATEAGLDEALAAIGDDVTCYVAVAPGAQPADLEDWLRARELEPGWGWMAFHRDLTSPPVAKTSLRLVEVDGETAEMFGRVVATGYALPPAIVPVCARAHEVGWDCWLAMEGDEPVAAAGVYVAEGAAYLGFAATLPEHRGKGAQSALLSARIRRAAERGSETVLTETGELRDGLPGNSYRNIRRAGFAEIAVTANWLRPARVGAVPLAATQSGSGVAALQTR